MFGDLDDIYDDDETLDLMRRYKEMLLQKNYEFFDLYEFESVIDYLAGLYKFQDAIKLACIAIRQHPKATGIRLKYAQLLIETSLPGKALRILRNIAEAEDLNHEYHLSLGFALNMTGKSSEAQKCFAQALRLTSEYKDEVTYSIAQSFLQYGLYHTAIKYLLLAYHYNKRNILVLYDLGLSYDKLNNSERSIFYYKKYLDIDPFAEHVWHNLGQLYTQRSYYNLAKEAFDLSLSINPQFLPAYFGLAELHLLMEKPEDAITAYKDLLSEDSANLRGLCALGNCYLRLGNYFCAWKNFKAALEVSNDFEDAWYGLAQVLFAQKKYYHAIQAAKKALSIDPDNHEFWYLLARIYSKNRKLNKAAEAYLCALQLNPANIKAGLAYAQILYRKRYFDEAIAVLLDLHLYAPDNSTINYRLAVYYVSQNNLDEAGRFFSKGLMMNFYEHIEIYKSYPKIRTLAEFREIIESHTTAALK